MQTVKLPGDKVIHFPAEYSDSQIEQELLKLFPQGDERDKGLDISLETIAAFRALLSKILDVAGREERDYSGIFKALLQAIETIKDTQPKPVDNSDLIKALTDAVKALKERPEKVERDYSKVFKELTTAVKAVQAISIPAPVVQVEPPSVSIPNSPPVSYRMTIERGERGFIQSAVLTPIEG